MHPLERLFISGFGVPTGKDAAGLLWQFTNPPSYIARSLTFVNEAQRPHARTPGDPALTTACSLPRGVIKGTLALHRVTLLHALPSPQEGLESYHRIEDRIGAKASSW